MDLPNNIEKWEKYPDDSNPCYEYRIPVEKVMEMHKGLFGDIDFLLNLSENELSDLPLKKLQTAKVDKVKEVVELISKYSAQSFVVDKDYAYILLEDDSFSQSDRWRKAVRLRWLDPKTSDKHRALMTEYSALAENLAFKEFLSLFAGFGFGVMPVEEFYNPESLVTTLDVDMEKLGDWSPSICLYYLSNGDYIICDKEGRIGYWSHEGVWEETENGFVQREVSVEKIGDSFESFIDWIIDKKIK